MLTQELKQQISDTYKKVSESMPGFRKRRSQAMMIAAIARGLTQEPKACVSESPTGVGKSLAYLIGAHAVARATEKKVVISTATVQLQEQLANKDVIGYLAASGFEAKVKIAKGRTRYACTRNMHQLTSNDDAQVALDLGEEAASAVWPRKPRAGEPEKISRLLAMLMDRKWDGDLDAPPEPIDAELMPLLSTTAGGCSNSACRHYKSCPFVIARRDVRDADIIISNQNLLLSDLMMKKGEDEGTGGVVLPDPSDCIFVVDEAHHLGAKAIEQGSARVHLSSAIRAFGKATALARAAYGSTAKEKMSGFTIEEGAQHVEEVRKLLGDMQDAIRATWVPSPEEKMPQWRAPQGQIPDMWRSIAEGLHIESALLTKWLRSMRRTVLESSSIGEGMRERIGRELGVLLERAEELTDLWRLWSTPDDAGRIPRARWVTLTEDSHLVCHASEVSAAGLLKRILFDQAAGVVLTSATLSAGGDFSWFARSVGLPQDAECVSLPSPFDLPNQATLVVPAVEALPNDFDGHVREITQWLTHKLPWDAGNLVLFTSRAKMEKVYSCLPAEHADKVLVQGVRSRPATLKLHKERIAEGKGSTLFGLASLGEGTDLVGDLLTTVVITQVPFSVPTDPVSATYAEYLESQRRNPFAEVSVPEATRLLVQYAGRLVRTETDVGQIVILDRRLVRQRYGKRMLDSLPPFRRVIERAKSINNEPMEA